MQTALGRLIIKLLMLYLKPCFLDNQSSHSFFYLVWFELLTRQTAGSSLTIQTRLPCRLPSKIQPPRQMTQFALWTCGSPTQGWLTLATSPTAPSITTLIQLAMTCGALICPREGTSASIAPTQVDAVMFPVQWTWIRTFAVFQRERL